MHQRRRHQNPSRTQVNTVKQSEIASTLFPMSEHTSLHSTMTTASTATDPTMELSTMGTDKSLPDGGLDARNHGEDAGLPETTVTYVNASLYVISGCSQPLLMTVCRNAGLADPSSQLYMLFYYLGPASVAIPLWWYQVPWPSTVAIRKGAGISCFDIFAQSLNYTGASLAGPTIFAIVYSSVTVWTAVFSQFLLGRTMHVWQWAAVVLVFGGLTLTATDSQQLGDKVLHGLTLVFLGSMMHALTYVMSEGIMTVGSDKLSVPQNCAIQGMVAATSFFLWQLIHTLPHWDEHIGIPMQEAGTTVGDALRILALFAGANLLHALTFFHTLRHFPGGATSAGVMKGLQAVLVFVVTHFAYCGRTGGDEMCFSRGKFLSLITVAGGVIGYGVATSAREASGSQATTKGYQQIDETKAIPEP